MIGTNIQSFTEMMHNQHSLQDHCHSQWSFFWCCFLLNMLYNQLFTPCPLPPESFIVISEKGISIKNIIAAISLIYNGHSILWLDQKSTSLIMGLLRPFVTSKKLLLLNSCYVKFKFTRKREKKPREALVFSPSTGAKAASGHSWLCCCPASHLYWHWIQLLHQLWSGLAPSSGNMWNLDTRESALPTLKHDRSVWSAFIPITAYVLVCITA